MMRKRWKALTLVLLLALCAAGCSKKLSDRFDRDALEEKVSTVISLAVQGDYDTLYEEEFSQQIITQIDQESLKTAVDEVIDRWESFRRSRRSRIWEMRIRIQKRRTPLRWQWFSFRRERLSLPCPLIYP